MSLDPLWMGSVAITLLIPVGISFTTVVKKLTIAPSIAKSQNAWTVILISVLGAGVGGVTCIR